MNSTIQAIAEEYSVAPCHIPEFIPSGFPALDYVTGGIPKGRIVDIHGAEDAGKTALAAALAKGNTLFLDAENNLTPANARKGTFVMRPDTLEDALEVCRTAALGFDTVVIDSIEALPTREDLRMGVGWYSMNEGLGRRERLLSDALPILSHELLANGCTLIIVNQMRNKQGVMYGRPDLSTGGKALPYYAALRLELSRVELTKERSRITGQVVRIRVEKNKYGTPFGRVELTLDYRRGWRTAK